MANNTKYKKATRNEMTYRYRQGWLEVSNTVGWNEEATARIHCLPESLLELFDSSFLARFSKVFVAVFSIACPDRFREVDAGSSRPSNRGHF